MRETGIFILHVSQGTFIVKVLHICDTLQMFAENMDDRETCNQKLIHLFDDGIKCDSLQEASDQCLELSEHNETLRGGIHELWIY